MDRWSLESDITNLKITNYVKHQISKLRRSVARN